MMERYGSAGPFVLAHDGQPGMAYLIAALAIAASWLEDRAPRAVRA